jgi:hypothetical protein
LVKLSDFNHITEMRLFMTRKLLILAVLSVAILTACQSAAGSPTTPPPADTDVELETPRAAASPTAEIAPTATQEASDDQKSNPDEANCTVVSRQPTPGPTEQSLVPLVSDTDWTHGPEDAEVTIIEYGDFQ